MPRCLAVQSLAPELKQTCFMKTKVHLFKTYLILLLIAVSLSFSQNSNAQCASGAAFVIGSGATNPTQWNGAPPSYGGDNGILSIVVDAGYTLEITNTTIDFVNDAVITVKSGGKLIINNSKLRIYSSCTSWDGINVLGAEYPYISIPDQYSDYSNRTLNMGSSGDPGYVEIKNGSIVRDVDGAAVWSEYGGIINLEESTIRNSKIGVKITEYDKHSSKGPGDYENACRLYESEILVNEIYGTNEYAGHYGIYLEDVSHIVIESCDIKNTDATNMSTDRGTGVYATNASFGLTKALQRIGSGIKDEPKTKSETNLCPDYVLGSNNNNISDFSFGIKAENLGTTDGFSLPISYCNFDDNKVSLEIHEGWLHNIDHVEIEVTSASYYWTNKTGANKPTHLFKMKDAEKFVLYRSTLSTNIDNVDYAIVDASGSLHSEIARCTFNQNGTHNSSTAVRNIGDCSGFTLLDNTFDWFEYDWVINSGAKVENSQVWNNDSRNTHSNGATYHIDNNGSENIDYYHATASVLNTDGPITDFDVSGATTPSYNEDFECRDHPMFVQKGEEPIAVDIYPNPTNGLISINASKYVDGFRIIVYNSKGQLVYKRESDAAQKKFDLSLLPNGMYHILLIADNMTQVSQNLIINH